MGVAMTKRAAPIDRVPVEVIGGGIAGLAVARAFASNGHPVALHEQAEAISEVGAGLQVSPNGMAVLDALGLGDEIRRVGVQVAAVELMDGLSGRRVASIPTDRAARPYLALHRSDLIDVLHGGARDAGASLEMGRRYEASDLDRLQGLVVGADGLHSVVRQDLNGSDSPFFTGQVAWRAVIDTGEHRDQTVARVYMAPGQHIVTYDLRGGRQRNIVAVHEQQAWLQEGWSHRGSAHELRVRFSAMCPTVQRDLARVDEVFVWGLFRHPIAPKWHDGKNRAIIGDAAHPTLPFLAQGANLALEDAWVLACQVTRLGVPAGLCAFQDARAARVKRAIETANANARNYHLRPPVARWIAHTGLAVLGRMPGQQLSRRFDWLYEHDVTQLN